LQAYFFLGDVFAVVEVVDEQAFLGRGCFDYRISVFLSALGEVLRL
jgi:hypothetical protein